MARDCFVYWDTTQIAPVREELHLALEEYAIGIATKIDWDEKAKRFFVGLPGLFEQDDQANHRWFEVHIGNNNIDVITREMDAITNAIAFGFAQQVSYKWKGRLEYG